MISTPIDDEVARNLPSLFVIALPRSLSSWTFERACASLRLSAPTWTSAGEILNTERWRMLREARDGDRFTPEDDAARFEQWSCFLDDTVRPRGRAYKDVVQPFVTARWLAGAHGRTLRVMRIHRPLADIAWSMLHAGWQYPARVAMAGTDDIDRLLSGLLRAHAALAQPTAVEVDFDALITNPHTLALALARLYPEVTMPETLFDDADFRAHSDTVLARRNTPLWRELDARIQALASDVGNENFC